MAIQLPNPGLGDGQTGDNEFVMWTKVKDNFNNSTHAASKLIGVNSGEVPVSESTLQTSLSMAALNSANTATASVSSKTADINNHVAGDVVSYRKNSVSLNMPSSDFASKLDYWTVYTYAGHITNSGFLWQLGSSMQGDASLVVRNKVDGTWSEWRSTADNIATYKRTSATAANVTVDSMGILRRASSSLKYKDVIAKLELDSDLYDKAMQIKPIIYRSKSEADPKDWHFMSFAAEELGEYDPSLTQWKTHDYNEDGDFVELEKKEAEGINLNAICAVLHATNIYQDKKLKELEQRLIALESNNEPIE